MVTLFFIRVVSVAIVLSIVIPVLMTMAVNYPISDFIHGPYNHCIGRFEVYFNPKHPDPFTPGRREGGRHCDDTYIWATVPDLSQGTRIFRLSIFSICKFTKLLFWLVTFCVPEMILYPVTFRYITTSTNQIARSGILLPDMVTRRRQQNSINIYVTWLACIAQFVTNIIFVVLMKGFFGKNKFYHLLFAIVTVSFNFNVMPIFYIILIDGSLKRAIFEPRSWFLAVKLFFTL